MLCQLSYGGPRWSSGDNRKSLSQAGRGPRRGYGSDTVGSGTGSFVLVGSGTGSFVLVGSGTGSFVLVGSGTGSFVLVGSGTGSLVFVGAGAGFVDACVGFGLLTGAEVACPPDEP